MTPEQGGRPDASPSGHPEDSQPARRRGHRRVVRRGTEREAVAGLSADETSAAWSDGATPGNGASADGNDDRLRRDVPPHW